MTPEEQKGIHDDHVRHFAAYLGLFTIAIACLAALFYLGPGITGFVTFSESVTSTESDSFSVSESGIVRISTDIERINALLVSGRVYGNGRAAVFLQGNDRNYLAYYFEGDAGSGQAFTDMCYDTCHVEGLGKDNTLIFELDNTRIDIDRIKYIYGRIIDFDLQPRKVSIDYKTDPASIVNLRLTNKENTDYKVLLYIDGPLSSSFSWQGSLIHMTSDQPEKSIPITVKLPSNLPEGEYVHKVTARYIPPDTHEFVGESPVAESFITVLNN